MIKENKMQVMPIPKLVINMSLPMMLSLLVQSLYNIVDSIFVARLSEDALTATSLAYPVQMLMIAIAVGTSVGVNALLSKTLGEKRQDEVKKIATTSLLLALFSSLIFIVLGIFCVDEFVNFFTDDVATGAMCKSYLTICMLFCPGTFFEMIGQRFLQSTGNTMLSMVSLITGAVTNIVLDPILIFGLFGVHQMGIRGAAIATVIGQWIAAAVALLLNHFKNPEVTFQFRNYRPEGKIIWRIYKVGLPTIVTQATGSVMISCINTILMPFSSTAVAFFGIYYKLQNFLFMPMNGLGQALIPIVSFNYGAKKGERIREALRVAVPIAVGVAIVAMLIFFILPAQLLMLFSAGEEMMEFGIPALRTIAVILILPSVTLIVGYFCSGLGNGLVHMLATVIRQLILFVPLAYLFAKSGEIGRVWYAMWIAEVIAFLYAVWATRREIKRKVEPLYGQNRA